MTKAKKSSLTEGQITITLDGFDRELIPSVDAIVKLSRTYDGLAGILANIRQMNLDAYVATIRYGLQISDKEAKDLPAKVYEAGIIELMAPLTEYVMLLLRGGRVASKEPDGDAPEGNV